MAELLTTDTELQTVANAIRGKTGGTAALGYPNGFATAIAGIGSDGNAAAGDIRSGKKAYVGNSTVNGTMPEYAANSHEASSSEKTIISAGRYVTGDQKIKPVTVSGLDKANIKNGATITVKCGDTTIATQTGEYDKVSSNAAAAGHILSGKKAFVNGSMVTGNIPSKAAAVYDAKTYDRTIDPGQYISGPQTIRGITTENISPENIKKGVTVKVGDTGSATRIKNVVGTCNPVNVSLPVSDNCYCPFMFKTTDTRAVRFYWQSNGWRVSAADSGNKPFMVPCPIKVTFYAESTSAGTNSITLQPGNVYWLNKIPGNNDAATITGSGVSTSIYKITKFEQA